MLNRTIRATDEKGLLPDGNMTDAGAEKSGPLLNGIPALFCFSASVRQAGDRTERSVRMLEAGSIAPDFTLPDADGKPVSLHDFAGQKVVLYFYPKDSTPGCTRQACAFAGAWEAFRAMGVTVIGVSKDSSASHRRFAEKYALPYLLLSDPERSVIRAYGAEKEKRMYGRTVLGVMRCTYVIDGDGKIELAMPDVKPDTNAAELLEYLKG